MARVYATTVDGTVFSLSAGADLQDAIAALRSRGRSRGDAGAALTATARVNGRTVRRGYKIRNGDVLTPVLATTLNSGAWVATDSADDDGAAGLIGRRLGGRGRRGGMDLEGLASSEWQSLPVPWPWSLVGSSAAEDSISWLREAEAKHGAVAVLAFATWLALFSLGEVSMETEPLTSLYAPVPAAAWALQGGAVALAEAYALQVSTSALIRNEARRRAAASSAAAGEAADTAASVDGGGVGGEGGATTQGATAGGGASATVRAAAVPSGSSFGDDFKRGFNLADPPMWSYGFVEMLSAMRMRGDDLRSTASLFLGRFAMAVMAILALHADVKHGLLHEFLERGGEAELNPPAVTLVQTSPPPKMEERARDSGLDIDDYGSASLATDILLQDFDERDFGPN